MMAENNAINNDIGVATGTSLNLGSTTNMTGMIDDDTFATASANTAASSESIKNYVDNLSAFTLLSSGTANTSSALEFTDLTGYAGILFVFTAVRPATNNVEFRLRTSSNNGSSYDSGASDYRFSGWITTDSPSSTGFSNASTDRIALALAVSNLNTSFVSGWLLMPGNSSALRGRVLWDVSLINASTNFSNIRASGHRKQDAIIDAVQFSFGSGNITSGSIYVYGLTA